MFELLNVIISRALFRVIAGISSSNLIIILKVVGLFKTGLVGKLRLHRTCKYTNEETPLSVPKQGLVPLLVYELS